jgi:hypothetical protein
MIHALYYPGTMPRIWSHPNPVAGPPLREARGELTSWGTALMGLLGPLVRITDNPAMWHHRSLHKSCSKSTLNPDNGWAPVAEKAASK